MPDELQALRLAEQGIAFIEKNPGMMTRIGEAAAATWSKAGRALGLVRGESAVATEAAAIERASSLAATAGKTESMLTQAERVVGVPTALATKVSAAERLAPLTGGKSLLSNAVNPFGTFGSHATEFLTAKKLAYGTGIAGVSLALAGCGKDKSAAPAATAKVGGGAVLPPGDGVGPVDTAAPGNHPSDVKVPVTMGTDGVPVLTGDPNQQPERGYPGGIGPDVKDVQEIINKVPGRDGYVAQAAFATFLHNYNSRVTESQIPKVLPLVDLPTNKEANRQFVWGNIDHWQLKHDVDMYVKADHGPLGTRDMRPNTDTAPGGGKLPPMFFAVGVDKENKPVDVLEYYKSDTGPKYREQYQFKYDQVDDGRMRVTVYNWMDSSLTRGVGPKQVIGTNDQKTNTLEGVTQYYYDADTHRCSEALYFNGWTFNRPKEEWKPMIDMKFTDNTVSISGRDPRSGNMLPFTTMPLNDDVTERTIRAKAAQMNFFNLLGLKLRDLPNGQ